MLSCVDFNRALRRSWVGEIHGGTRGTGEVRIPNWSLDSGLRLPELVGFPQRRQEETNMGFFQQIKTGSVCVHVNIAGSSQVRG